MKTGTLKQMDKEEVIALAEAFDIEDAEEIAKNDFDYLCAQVSHAFNKDD